MSAHPCNLDNSNLDIVCSVSTVAQHLHLERIVIYKCAHHVEGTVVIPPPCFVSFQGVGHEPRPPHLAREEETMGKCGRGRMHAADDRPVARGQTCREDGSQCRPGVYDCCCHRR